MKSFHTSLLAFTTALAILGSASAATVVSNFGEIGSGGLTITSGFASGQALSTPATGPGWTLDSLTFTLRETATGGSMTVALYSDASGDPGSLLATLTGASPSGGTFTDYTYIPTSSFTLNPNSTYFVVLSATSPSDYEWLETNTAESGDPGWTIADISRRDVGGTPFNGSPLRMEVNATAVPEPSGVLLSLAGLGSLVIRRRR